MRKSAIEDKIRQALTEVVSPKLRQHGGDIELKSYAAGVAEVYFRGACAGCPGAVQTLEDVVALELSAAVPEVHTVRIAQDLSEDMLAMARQILSRPRAKE